MSFYRSSLRDRGRGRAIKDSRGGINSCASYAPWSKAPPPVPTGPFGATVDSINSKSLLIEEASPRISNVKYVASYNWLDGKMPTVLVPGSPAAWAPPAKDFQLKQDAGVYFRDTNAAHYPLHPMEPAIRSILALQPDFNLQSVDIVGCGSTIGNLLRFVSSKNLPFRFDADVVGDTIFFIRKECSPTETLKDVRGYGHTFPENYTTWDVETRGSVSHQRLIQYGFGDLRVLVRTETDGYIRDTASNIATNRKYQESLEDVLDNMAVNQVSLSPSFDQKLKLKMQGHLVAQKQIFDIKTRAQQNIFDMEEILPRLWVNQTPNFLIAYHKYGLFDNPEIMNVKPEVQRWAKDNAAVLGRFHATLRRIVDVLRDSESQQVEVSWDGDGPLLISEQIGEGRRALPPDLCESLGD